MLYFFLLLLLEFVLSAVMALLLMRASRRNTASKVRHAIMYLLPVVIAVLLIVFSLLFTIPGILDAERILLGEISPQQVTISRITHWGAVLTDGRKLSHAPWGVDPVEGGVYMATIAPRSRIILHMEPAGSALK
jgi:predicted PurR-regulated permease PerM